MSSGKRREKERRDGGRRGREEEGGRERESRRGSWRRKKLWGEARGWSLKDSGGASLRCRLLTLVGLGIDPG